jgi:Tol biopolymer transport system component
MRPHTVACEFETAAGKHVASTIHILLPLTMALTPGTKVGTYQVLTLLGIGGMGEVYRATDSRLGRDVAIKILPAALAQDADRLARFEREAKTLAALNHPNIAHIHGLEESASVRALVMELVEGEDLSALIARGPIPLADALPIARQIAAALEAAHEQGIVHRDLKPANVKVRADGTVKVLDFGLAKATDPRGASGSIDPAMSPTLTAHMTQLGVILGTAAYMAPEQARGKAVDKRADIWAFGAVVFEMLTGARAFPGDDVTDTLAAVVRAEPNWALLPAGVPPTLVTYLRRALEKDPKQRVPDASTMRLALDGAFDVPPAGTPAPVAAHRGPRPAIVWVLAGLAALSFVVAVVALWTRPAAIRPPEVRLAIALPPGAELTSYPAITRDGRTVAYVAQQGAADPQLYLRDLDAFDSRIVAGSSGAREPFFSPDGKWVAFFANGQLQKAEVAGGAPIRMAEASYPFGGTWTTDDAIVYAASLSSGLLQIPASGGAPRQISRPDGAANGYAHVFPQALPGGRALLFSMWGRDRGTVILSRESGKWDMLLPVTTFASALYDPSAGAPGRLLIVDDAAGVRAAPFDPDHPARTSAGGSVLDNVYYQMETEAGAWLAVSENGTAVFAAGNPAKTSLVWVSRDGAISPLGRKQDVYREVNLSPDGTKAAVRQGLNLWAVDLASGTSSPLTLGNDSNILPVWSRDGRRVVFASNRGGDWDIYSQPADGSRPAEVLLKRPSEQFPYGFAPDGTLLYTEISPTTGRDLWTLSPEGKPSPFRVTRFNEFAAQFSPEPGGPHWIAYASDESGQPEIYVESYPGGARRIPVSSGGGARPIWSPDGRELYFLTRDALVVVTLQPNGTFGAPRKVIDTADFQRDDRFQSYSVAPDGKRILMIHRDEGSAPRQLNVIVNWSSAAAR